MCCVRAASSLRPTPSQSPNRRNFVGKRAVLTVRALCTRFDGESSMTKLPAVPYSCQHASTGRMAVQQTSAPPSDTHDQVPTVFLRMPSVMQMTGLGRSTIYRLMAQQQFPCPVRLGVRAVAWRRSELNEWSQTRPAASH